MDHETWNKTRRERFPRALHLRYQSTLFTMSGAQVCVASWCTGTGRCYVDDVKPAAWEIDDWRNHVTIGA